jgi:mRNA-degrading endonuclease YafQ of YafQ-DinJ toxin-antitoxin module
LQETNQENPQLKEKINYVFDLLSESPFFPPLKSHKLGGKIKDLWSCSVASDCRIIFCIDKSSAPIRTERSNLANDSTTFLSDLSPGDKPWDKHRKNFDSDE